MELDEKLDNFYKSAINDATEQSILIIEEYKKSLQSIYEEHKVNAIKKADAAYRIESDNILREKNKILSSELLNIKRKISETTNVLINQLFLDVTNKVKEFMNTPDYQNLLIKQVLEAKEFAKDEDITTYLDPSDEKLKSAIERETGCQLVISNISFIGGTRTVIHAKNILIDNSFSTKISELKDTFTI